MNWSETVKESVLVKCGRHCCICHKFCGLKMELHHIIHVSEGGKCTEENCIPLCFDCHADQRSYDHKHPKGTKYSRDELKKHRDKWFQLSAQNLGTGSNDHLEQDKDYFLAIIKLLPLHPTIALLRILNFNVRSFDGENFESIHKFLHHIDQEPWLHFYDSDLESLRLTLIENLRSFNDVYGAETFTFSSFDYGRRGVPREWIDEEEGRDGSLQIERYEKAVSHLNEYADRIDKSYTELLSLGRAKLCVVIPSSFV